MMKPSILLTYLTSLLWIQSSFSTCYDISGWMDLSGETCEWYNDDAVKRCVQYGFEYKYLGYVAATACCACGGGVESDYAPTTRPTTVPTVEPSINLPCTDDKAFYDEENDFSCNDYAYFLDDDVEFLAGNTRCDMFGDVSGANVACCVCGGGYRFVPSISPSVSRSPFIDFTPAPTFAPSGSECMDIYGWENSVGDSCRAFDKEKCEDQGDSSMTHGLTANDACCKWTVCPYFCYVYV